MADSEADNPPKSCIVRIGSWILSKSLSMSWIYPAAICLVIGQQINFKAALIAATIISWLILLISYILFKCTSADSPFHPIVFPKLFEVVNPVAYSMLLPVAIYMGEDFCRVWIGVITLGILCVVILGSMVVRKPWLSEAIPLPEDERLHPMTWETRYWATGIFGIIFLIMFASNVIVAVEGYEFGTAYIMFNFVIPYSSLGLGITFMPFVGKWIWFRSAKKHYGENWQQELFGDETEENGLIKAEETRNVQEATSDYVLSSDDAGYTSIN